MIGIIEAAFSGSSQARCRMNAGAAAGADDLSL